MHDTYARRAFRRYKKHTLGMIGLIIFLCFFIVGTYAPLFASSLPLAIKYDNHWYFPLFRHLFFSGFYTKSIDIFFNLLMLTLPLFLIAFFSLRNKLTLRVYVCSFIALMQILLFTYFMVWGVKDPASDPLLTQVKNETAPEQNKGWAFELQFMNDYKKLLTVYSEWLNKKRDASLSPYKKAYFDLMENQKKTRSSDIKESDEGILFPTLWEKKNWQEKHLIEGYKRLINENQSQNPLYKQASTQLNYLEGKQAWLKQELNKISFVLMPFFSSYHWEDNAGGNQYLNELVDWNFLTRINRKDLTAALLFGIRISLVVGITATFLAIIIGIPIGGLAGYFGGRLDIIVSRLMEIWEAMPAFFMLLMIVAILQSKSIFLIIIVIGFFSWTSISRYIRAEFFKQRNLSYVDACKMIGLTHRKIIFSHILPNAIPPVLTLLPFVVMGAITSEAGLSFLGLGEEGSSSWGVLMDEGRSAFPGESYLLWPPAILLTLLLIAIALIGDALRDTLDPKLLR